MDLFTALKIVHSIAITVLLISIILQSIILFRLPNNDKAFNVPSRQKILIVQHSIFLLLFITGGILLYLKHFQVQHWFYAKALLFVVIISSSVKAFKKPNPNILLVQRRGGIVLAWIAFVAIIALVVVKPTILNG
ncbi:SirB2 family protein [Acinetobacter boissieri]|uniref:Invasion gene expression up-regulator, SirB n=1 Tax=Acinetobacter boissieri TaxID=1219383 RepID=A0A1G6HL39_9GAMM|nr:SirB2 family protein [Acinetobacter boissieri]SDB95027.1 Invasion gene expression up-regulator, SirB [Acinetobacter boissieri]